MVAYLKVKDQILQMTLNDSGIRDTACVLKISPTTVINELKKRIVTEQCEISGVRLDQPRPLEVVTASKLNGLTPFAELVWYPILILNYQIHNARLALIE